MLYIYKHYLIEKVTKCVCVQQFDLCVSLPCLVMIMSTIAITNLLRLWNISVQIIVTFIPSFQSINVYTYKYKLLSEMLFELLLLALFVFSVFFLNKIIIIFSFENLKIILLFGFVIYLNNTAWQAGVYFSSHLRTKHTNVMNVLNIFWIIRTNFLFPYIYLFIIYIQYNI